MMPTINNISNNITSSIKVDILPFSIPENVQIVMHTNQSGKTIDSPVHKIHLRDVPESALEDLCNQYRDEVYKAADKVMPIKSHKCKCKNTNEDFMGLSCDSNCVHIGTEDSTFGTCLINPRDIHIVDGKCQDFQLDIRRINV